MSPTIWSLLFIGGGLTVLIVGGELLVRGAASLARSFGVSAIVVGMTIVAAGTSAPELVVSVMAAVRNNPAICAGNVVGSNIFNIILILGLAAIICPLKASGSFVRRRTPVMIGVSGLFAILVLDGLLGTADAVILFVAFIGYTIFAIWQAKRESASLEPEFDASVPTRPERSRVVNVMFILVGLGALVAGSELFLRGAVAIARGMGISETVIGLTLVAIGTSMPELVTSVVAAVRKQPDIALGNVIGSNVFNLGAILGISGILRPIPFDHEMRWIHVPVLLGTSALVWVFIATGLRLSRREGFALLTCFVLYLGWMIREAT